jgi:hypothetical protein
MQLKVYNAEKFERTKIWYVLFSCIFVLIIIASIFYKNIVWIILMFFLIWAYIYYGLINVSEINISISENGLVLDRIIPRSQISWFCLELELDKEKNVKRIKNIVFIYPKWHSIHTISDSEENLSAFVTELSQYTEMLETYPQTSREKFMRKIKL